MIYYMRKNCELMQQDVVVLEHFSKEQPEQREGVIVLSSAIYKTALLIDDKFGGNYKMVERKIPVRGKQNVVDYFAENAPKPLSILAPFLHLIQCGEPLPEDIEILCGYLHMISMSIDFSLYLEVKEELRTSLMFNLRQVERYKENWKDLEVRVKLAEVDEDAVTREFIKTLTVEVAKDILGEVLQEVRELAQTVTTQVPGVPMYIPQAAAYPVQPIPAEQGAEEGTEEEGLPGLGDMLDSLLTEELAAIEKENKETSVQEADKSGEAEKPADEKPEGEAAEVSVIDKLISMYGGK